MVATFTVRFLILTLRMFAKCRSWNGELAVLSAILFYQSDATPSQNFERD